MTQNQKIQALLEELLAVLSDDQTEADASVPAKKKAPKISKADRQKSNKARQKKFTEFLQSAKASKQDQKKCLAFLQKATEVASTPTIWHSHIATVEKCHKAWIKA
tara:strand:+ start:441 stop:758 length:318 start_codon:yes stop_codon:yes gene_type:complete